MMGEEVLMGGVMGEMMGEVVGEVMDKKDGPGM